MAYQIRGDHGKAIADLEQYLIEGSHAYWRESAERQLGLLREITAERQKARRNQILDSQDPGIGPPGQV